MREVFEGSAAQFTPDKQLKEPDAQEITMQPIEPMETYESDGFGD